MVKHCLRLTGLRQRPRVPRNHSTISPRRPGVPRPDCRISASIWVSGATVLTSVEQIADRVLTLITPGIGKLKAMLEAAGLADVEVFNLAAGVVALHRGYRF